MNVQSTQKKDGALFVSIHAERGEVAAARRQIYLDDLEHYPVPGCAPGLAPLEKLEEIYGTDVFYDAALQRLIWQQLQAFLRSSGERVLGRPQVLEVSDTQDGGVTFTLRAELYPEVDPGEYRGISVPLRLDDPDFSQAVLARACARMQGDVTEEMVRQQLDAMLAQEKLKIRQDAIYYLLADTIVLLRRAYELAEVHRPMAQVRAEALDVMLQTVSAENQDEDSQALLLRQLQILAKRYHTLPEDYDAQMEQALQKRLQDKASMDADQLADEAFAAYLGTLELDEKHWRETRQDEARYTARCDLLLDAVARREELAVSQQALQAELETIAEQCGMELSEALPQIDPEPIRAYLLRAQALQLLCASAVSTAPA